MKSFEPIPLYWEGKEYIIPSRKIMPAIARIEDVVTLTELQEYAARGTMPIGKIAMSYGAVLRFAGANITDEEVYSGMFGAEGQDQQATAMIAVQGLMEMMMPPDMRRKGLDQQAGNQPATETPAPAPAVAKSEAAAPTSKKLTSPVSQTRKRAG